MNFQTKLANSIIICSQVKQSNLTLPERIFFQLLLYFENYCARKLFPEPFNIKHEQCLQEENNRFKLYKLVQISNIFQFFRVYKPGRKLPLRGNRPYQSLSRDKKDWKNAQVVKILVPRELNSSYCSVFPCKYYNLMYIHTIISPSFSRLAWVLHESRRSCLDKSLCI